MKKLIIALLFTILPPLSIALTTPLTSLEDHISHIILFTVLGLCMAIFSLKSEITAAVQSKKYRFLPSFGVVLLVTLFSFLAVYSMPCPYMFSSDSAQTMINHPCSQPVTPAVAALVFIPVISSILAPVLQPQKNFVALSLSLVDTRAPPVI